MTPAALARVRCPERAPARRRPARSQLLSGGRLTLDELVSSAWAGLAARVPVACPMCGGRMDPQPQLPARCRGCGSELG